MKTHKLKTIQPDYVMFVENDKITIQRADYIEDGCYVEIVGNEITLFEIPLGGGDKCMVGKFNSIIEALKHADTLT